MFWKLALTVALAMLLFGRSGLHRNPIARLLLPKAWVAWLSASPVQSLLGSRRDPRFARRVGLALAVLAGLGLIAWFALHWTVARETAT